jgi:hypothetical protein
MQGGAPPSTAPTNHHTHAPGLQPPLDNEPGSSATDNEHGASVIDRRQSGRRRGRVVPTPGSALRIEIPATAPPTQAHAVRSQTPQAEIQTQPRSAPQPPATVSSPTAAATTPDQHPRAPVAHAAGATRPGTCAGQRHVASATAATRGSRRQYTRCLRTGARSLCATEATVTAGRRSTHRLWWRPAIDPGQHGFGPGKTPLRHAAGGR